MPRVQQATTRYLQLGTANARDPHSSRGFTKMRSLAWKLIRMSLAMASGMIIFYLLVLVLRASSSYGALFQAGTDLYAIGMAIFMTVPTWVVAQCGDGNRNTGVRDDCLRATDRLPHLG